MATNETDPDDGDDGDRRIESWSDYRDLIEVHADGVEEAIEEDPVAFTDEQAIRDEIDRTAGNAYPSYNTGTALQTLYHTHAEPTEWDQHVADGAGWRSVVQTMAWLAIIEDLTDELSDRGRL